MVAPDQVSQPSGITAIPVTQPFLGWALRDQEGGWIGAEIRNTSGTHDLGPLQINSWWVPRIAALVRRPNRDVRYWLIHDPCFNAEAARWIFHSVLLVTGNYWKAVGAYHSPTADRQKRYAASVAVHHSWPFKLLFRRFIRSLGASARMLRMHFVIAIFDALALSGSTFPLGKARPGPATFFRLRRIFLSDPLITRRGGGVELLAEAGVRALLRSQA